MEIAIFKVSDVDLTEVRQFVTRDLKRAFEPYFSSVEVIDEHNDLFAAMEWAFALRPSEQPEWTFSFSDRATSSQPMMDGGDNSIFSNVLQEGLRRMLAEYQRSGAQAKLLQ